jgi:peptide/nickel transport system permease protein
MTGPAWTTTLGVLLLVGLGGGALLAPVLPLADPNLQDLALRYASPTAIHALGTDAFGRDMLSRIAWGTRTSLALTLSSVAGSAAFGTTLGLIAGHRRGVVDSFVGRLMDLLLSYPPLLLGMMVLVGLGSGTWQLALGLALGSLPKFVRLVRGETLVVRDKLYVEASRAIGCSALRTMRVHILPNVASTITVAFTILLPTTMLTEAGLSFLGLGVPPPAPTLGNMIRTGMDQILGHPLLVVFPSLALLVAAYALNLIGDARRDSIDVRAR